MRADSPNMEASTSTRPKPGNAPISLVAGELIVEIYVGNFVLFVEGSIGFHRYYGWLI